jgi:hypothetical protein
MKAEIVVPRPQRHADAASGLVTGDKGGRDLTARAAPQFGKSKQGGQNRDRRMAGHRHVDVVVIERMRRRAVDERCR